MALLDEAHGDETKKNVLKLLVQLSSSAEGKLAIGQHESFHKLLDVLRSADGELAAETVRTLKHFLTFAHADEELTVVVQAMQQPGFFAQVMPTKLTSLLQEAGRIINSEVMKTIGLPTTSLPLVVQSSDSAKVHPLYSYMLTGTAIDELLLHDSESTAQADFASSNGSTELKNLIRLQGGLEALTSMLGNFTVSQSGKLDLVETLANILIRNSVA